LPKYPYGRPAKEIILQVLEKSDKPLTVKEISQKTGIKYNTVRGCLQRLRREGLVKNVGQGWTIAGG